MSQEHLKIFKALADQTRLDIVLHLWQKGEMPCQDLSQIFSLSQPTLSHHFRKLISADIIVERKEGTAHYYRINKKYLESLGLNLKSYQKQLT